METGAITGASSSTEKGGLSGKPLANKSTDFINKIYSLTDGKWPIIGVGGISNSEDAWEKITAGASLLQAYSGFVFEGAGLTKAVVNGLSKKLKQHGLTDISEAVGLSHRTGSK